MSRIKELNKLGQSVWLDFIRRSLITSGEMEALIARGVSGITSNPTIFEKAIAGSSDYDEALRELVDEGKTNDEIYQALAVDDIRRAADLFRPVWDATGGADGYVSLEANPKLAYDTEGTIAEAKMLFKAHTGELVISLDGQCHTYEGTCYHNDWNTANADNKHLSPYQVVCIVSKNTFKARYRGTPEKSCELPDISDFFSDSVNCCSNHIFNIRSKAKKVKD